MKTKAIIDFSLRTAAGPGPVAQAIHDEMTAGGRFERGAPGGIRTHDQRIRNPLLYPTELRVLVKIETAYDLRGRKARRTRRLAGTPTFPRLRAPFAKDYCASVTLKVTVPVAAGASVPANVHWMAPVAPMPGAVWVTPVRVSGSAP